MTNFPPTARRDAEDDAEVCPDHHTCRNGSHCLLVDRRRNKYVCDCETSEDTAFAGLSCEHEATIYCNELNKFSYTSFCTNNGICLEHVGTDGEHQGCKCTENYTGDFCQFVKGQTIPDHFLYHRNPTGISQENNSSRSGSPAAIFAAIAAVLLVVGASLMLLHWNRTRTSSTKNLEASPDLQLEADGAVLQRAIEEEGGEQVGKYSPTARTEQSDEETLDHELESAF